MRGMLLLLASLVTVGCGASLPPPPTTPDLADLAPERVDPEGMDEEGPLPLTLFPGDILTVTTVSTETTVLDDVVVDGAGRIHLPLVGDIDVGGQQLSEAESRIEEAMQQFDRFARTNVHVSDPQGHKATVLGAVATPGEVEVGPGARIADLLASAGGPRIEVTEQGGIVSLSDLEEAQVFRSGQRLPISVARALEGHPRHNVRAHPGDHIHVPTYEMPNITVTGLVNGSGSFRYYEGIRVSEAIALAGGPADTADDGDIRIVRGGPESPEAYTMSLEDLRDGESHDPVLAPGDVVLLRESGGTKFARVMTALAPFLAAATAVAVTVLVIESNNP